MRICTWELVSSACLAAMAWASFRERSLSAAALAVIGFQLLDAELAGAELFEKGFDFADAGAFGGVGFADEDVYAFDVEFAETALQFGAGFDLDFVAAWRSSSMVFLWATSRK